MTNIDKQVEKIIKKDILPDYYAVGARKAYESFQDFYGETEGKRIFIQKTLDQGQGKTLKDKITSVYKNGAKLASKNKNSINDIIPLKKDKSRKNEV